MWFCYETDGKRRLINVPFLAPAEVVRGTRWGYSCSRSYESVTCTSTSSHPIFFGNVRASLPDTKIFVIGIKPSIARYHLREKQLKINKLTSNLANEEESLVFIDVWNDMILNDGKADPNLFVEDGLHMNENGYLVWKELVKPVLSENF